MFSLIEKMTAYSYLNKSGWSYLLSTMILGTLFCIPLVLFTDQYDVSNIPIQDVLWLELFFQISGKFIVPYILSMFINYPGLEFLRLEIFEKKKLFIGVVPFCLVFLSILVFSTYISLKLRFFLSKVSNVCKKDLSKFYKWVSKIMVLESPLEKNNSFKSIE